jgi:hypothetical protein
VSDGAGRAGDPGQVPPPVTSQAGAEDSSGAPGAATAGAGVRALASDDFSMVDSVGGVRGVVEAMAPGLVFVVLYVATRELMPPLVASLAVAVAAVVARLVQRTPVTQAFGGLFGVAIGVFWAWRSGDATQYFAYGLWTNGAYLAVMLVSVAVSWPIVGVVVEALRGGFGATTQPSRQPGPVTEQTDQTDGEPVEAAAPAPVFSTAWRSDRALLRRYTLATWLWIGMFALRLAVQIPLYFSSSVGWLGTARLVMGVPLWALVLWGTWLLVRRPAAPAAR